MESADAHAQGNAGKFGCRAYGAGGAGGVRVRLKNFKSHCDQWMAKYLSTLPPQCKNFQTYLMSYQSSRKNMKQKYDEAGKMFFFN
jgi:hypothetical protein